MASTTISAPLLSAHLPTPESYLSPPTTNPATSPRSRSRRRNRSRSRRRKGTWKKLLWVRQSYPDNYTDGATFLDAMQTNPQIRFYEFWPLVADSTVIVQQLCTMILFVCCFSGIVQERVSAFTVVCWGTVGTVGGWVLWDHWVGQEEVSASKKLEKEREQEETNGNGAGLGPGLGHGHGASNEWKGSGGHAIGTGTGTVSASGSIYGQQQQGLGLKMPSPSPISHTPRKGHSRQSSSGSLRFNYLSEHQRNASLLSLNSVSTSPAPKTHERTPSSPTSTQPAMTPRTAQRLATAKSAILIYCALLGLSPILKSLTQSTASDSIWAMSFWLMCINVVFFDYGSGVGATFPASLSTNAALMASTVLASRLLKISHVFSLTLFSIEVFGLFPVFRRYLRHISWDGHLALTWFLVMGASAGVALNLSGGGWMAAVVGVVLGSLLTGLAMGICSWWLIGMQRYKNEIYGPWDPARPIIRRWD